MVLTLVSRTRARIENSSGRVRQFAAVGRLAGGMGARGRATCVLAGICVCVVAACGDAPVHGAATDGDTEAATDPSGGAEGGSDSSKDDDGDDEPGIEVPPQPLHRLNRLEYDNTVRDLLGTDLRPASEFVVDPEANGFDNMADQLGMSPALLDGFDRAAFQVIADALDDRPLFSARFGAKQLQVTGGYEVGELWALFGSAATVTFDVPEDLEVEIVLHAGASVVGTAAAPTANLQLDGALVAAYTIGGTGANPAPHVFATTLTAGTHVVDVVPTNFVNAAEQNISNNVLVSRIEVRSVLMTDGPGRDLVYVCEPLGLIADYCYEQILAHFASRAWRRPVTDDEAEDLSALFRTVRDGGESNDDALRLVMRAIMTSPKFLYRLRTTGDADDDKWLDDYVLASRLSYFLWSSMPDDRLFAMAEEGRLATRTGLSEAVAWMLEDEKAEALLHGFAEQWLSTRMLAAASPSPEVYPDFDEAVRAAMIQESKLFFGDFLSNGLPVTRFIRPDFAYLNDRLAAHYGLAPVGSESFVRVAVGDGDRRGLLLLGAWLTSHSHAERGSPIRRGRWLSDRLLCAPVPPPPPGLEFEPVEVGDSTSVREQLEKHRSDPSCASCHVMLDGIGIGVEELDGVARVLTDGVDNRGALPDGRAFAGADELSDLYAEREEFVECFAQKLFTYAMGRAPDSFDDPYLEEIAAKAVDQGWDLPAFIDALVHTPAFRSPGAMEAE